MHPSMAYLTPFNEKTADTLAINDNKTISKNEKFIESDKIEDGAINATDMPGKFESLNREKSERFGKNKDNNEALNTRPSAWSLFRKMMQNIGGSIYDIQILAYSENKSSESRKFSNRKKFKCFENNFKGISE